MLGVGRETKDAWSFRRVLSLSYALPLILVVAGALRLININSQSIWLDEAFSIYIANQPLDRMLDIIIKHDTPPPLYYVLLHYWLGFGDTALNARLLSALFGIVTVAVVYLLGRDLIDRTVGLITALFLAVSPFHIWYSQETRMYSLLFMLCMLSVYFLLRALQTGKRVFWVSYVVATSLATYTQISSMFFVIGEWMAVIIYIIKTPHTRPNHSLLLKLLRPWFLSQAALLLLWLPWLPNFLQQSQTYQRFWIEYPTPELVVTLFLEFSSAYLPHWKIPYGREILITFTIILALLAARRLARRDYLFLLSLFAIPIATMYLFSLSKPIFLSRALIFCIAPFLMLIAGGIVGLNRARLGYGLAVALVLLNLISLYRLYTVSIKEEWDIASGYVAANASAGDLVLFLAADTQIPFDYYTRDSDVALETRGLPVDVFAVGPLEPPMTLDDLARMDQLIDGRESFWLVVSHSEFPDPEGITRSHADDTYQRLEQKEFQGILISRYKTSE